MRHDTAIDALRDTEEFKSKQAAEFRASTGAGERAQREDNLSRAADLDREVCSLHGSIGALQIMNEEHKKKPYE